MQIVSVRDEPAIRLDAIRYFQQQWASADTMMMYDDAITRCIGAENPLPQWYVLRDGARLVGCAGLITNDFISRGELYPWLCALHVEQDLRGRITQSSASSPTASAITRGARRPRCTA